MIPRLKPNYDYTDWLALLKFWNADFNKYEQKFANKFQNSEGVMFSYGRTGLYALFKIWNLHDVEIICPAYTCVVVPHAIVLSGNIPVFVDSSEDSFNMSLAKLEAAITENTRAVILTHIFGYPMDVVAAQDIITRAENKFGHKIYVIQDVAHSYGAKWNNNLVTQYGDAAIFGCNISKLINSIFGGMVITNNETTASLLRQFKKDNGKTNNCLRTLKRIIYFLSVNVAFNEYVYGAANFLENHGFLDYFVKYFSEDKIDFPMDWDEFPCGVEMRIGNNQLKKYESIVKTRQNNARELINILNKRNDVQILPYCQGATYSHFVALVQNRDHWVQIFRKNNIQLGILIEYCIPYLKAYNKYKREDYPNAKKYSQQTINFPIWGNNLTNKIDKILQKV